MKELLRVLFVTEGYHMPRGGAESAGKKWFDIMSEKVAMTLLTNKPNVFTHPIRRSRLAFMGGANPFSFLKYAIEMSWKIRKACKKQKIDLIHIQSFSGYSVIPPLNVPCLVTLHDEPFVDIDDPISPGHIRLVSSITRIFARFLKVLMLSRAQYLHAIGTKVAELARHRFPHLKYRYIPNPSIIEPPPESTITRHELLKRLDLPDDAIIILAVGTLEVRKSQHRFIEIASRFREYSNVHFVVVGGTPNFISKSYFKKIRHLALSRKLTNLHFTGFVSKELLHSLYSNSNLFISLSRSEACNLALLEANRYKIPIITTDVGASRDLFSGTSIIISRNPTESEITDAIHEGLRNPMTSHSSNRDLSEEEVGKKLLDYYEDIIEMK